MFLYVFLKFTLTEERIYTDYLNILIDTILWTIAITKLIPMILYRARALKFHLASIQNKRILERKSYSYRGCFTRLWADWLTSKTWKLSCAFKFVTKC